LPEDAGGRQELLVRAARRIRPHCRCRPAISACFASISLAATASLGRLWVIVTIYGEFTPGG
jgi:hypothetical protein